MATDNIYDVAVVGGGLAGLALSIQLARQGHSVIVFEKESYPFHRVCGEYISLESWNFLQALGLDLKKIGVPIITRLQVSGINGKLLAQPLPLGGFGISRYRLDDELARIAIQAGVIIKDNSKVNDILFKDDGLIIEAGKEKYAATVVAGAYGKRSNIDIKWKRPFSLAAGNKLNNYIGVKYHIQTEFPDDTIALHNFRNGYCGIVKVEEDKYCLCYLTTAANLQENNGDIGQMERVVLSVNPHLRKIFEASKRLYDAPLTISQVSFDKKSQVDNHVLMIGDAAGMITPLCGNGMSMALHGSKLAASPIHDFLSGGISREQMEKEYSFQWQKHFSKRLKMGRRIQRLFGRKWITNLFVTIAKTSPRLVNTMVRMTHGKSF